MNVLFRVELYMKDIEKSLHFYQKILGLELFGRSERCGRFNYDCFSLLITAESALEENHYFYQEGKSDKKGNGFELIIVVDDVAEVYEQCLTNHYPIQVDIETYPWDMRGFKVTDPDGYFLRITSK